MVECVGIVGILAVAALVVVPLIREYADFRRAWGLGRLSALGVTGLVVPAVVDRDRGRAPALRSGPSSSGA